MVEVKCIKDKGLTYENVSGDPVFWIWSVDEIIYNITEDIILRFVVDNTEFEGGFVATITMKGANGEVMQFYTDAEMTNFTSSAAMVWNIGFNDPDGIWYAQSAVNSELEPVLNYIIDY